MKAKRRVCIREFEHLVEYGSLQVGSGVGQVSHTAFSFLRGLLHEGREGVQGEPLFKLTTYRRQTALKAQNYVGVIQSPCGTQIEILPKLYDEEAHGGLEETRRTLINMLRCLKNSPFKHGGTSEIRDERMPLLEVYISQFLSQTNQLVKRGIRSDYVRQRSNKRYLKGRLLVSQQLQKNAMHPEQFFTDCDEYRVDRPANRLIKLTLEIAKRASQSAANQKLARELSFAFDEVPLSTDIRSDFKKVRLNRGMRYYEGVLDWCDLLLNGRGSTPSSGKFQTISLFYPMERVFEDFVANRLKAQVEQIFGAGCKLKSQSASHSLVEDHGGSKIFNLRPDLMIYRDGHPICVIDTKWKSINSSDRKNKYGISQADMYQLYAYGHKYLKNNSQKELMLVYPTNKNFQSPLPPFHYEDGFRLKAVPFDLERGRLILEHD